MPTNAKITDLASFSSGTPLAEDDVLVGVDVSDTSMATTGTDKNFTVALLRTLLGVPLGGSTGMFLRMHSNAAGDWVWETVSHDDVGADASGAAAQALVDAEGYTDTRITNLSLGTASTHNVPASGDATSTQVVLGTDSRLTNSRTPTGHHASHETGGGDAITTLAASVIASGVLNAARIPTLDLIPAPVADLAMNGHKITGGAAGTASTDFVTKSQLDALIAAADAMVFKGVIDCSANPNYPAADAGATYKISVAGKIGGASGVNVEIGDTLLCTADGTAAGNQATVGQFWNITQANLDGAVIGPAASTDQHFVFFSGSSGKLIADSGLSLDTDGTLAANSDTRIASQKSIVTYVATATSTLAAKANPTFTTGIASPMVKVTGLTGATVSSRYVGATASGPPASGTFLATDWSVDATGKFWVCTTGGTPGTWAQVSGGVDGIGLAPTAVKTISDSPVTAAIGQIVRVDASGGSPVVTLPTAPAAPSTGVSPVLAVKCVALSGSNVVTINCGGSDKINIPSGVASTTLIYSGHSKVFVYNGTDSTWTVVADDVPISGLDTRYRQTAAQIVDADVSASAGIQSSKISGSLPVNRFGGLRAFGHSYMSVGGFGASSVGNFNNFVRRVAAALQIPVGEVDFWYHGGMLAASPNIGDPNAGIGGVFRHSYPDHAYGPPGTTQSMIGKAAPYLDIMCLGVNDTGDAQTTAAAIQGMRAVLTLWRARSLYPITDASVATTGAGWGAAQTDKNYVSYGTYLSTAKVGDSITLTLPLSFTGGNVALLMLGGANGTTTVNAANTLNSTSTTSLVVVARDSFPQSGSFVIQLSDSPEQMLVTAGQGTGAGTFTVQRGYNGTTATLHNTASLTVTRPTNLTYLTFGGTSVAGSQVSVGAQDASGRLFTSGQGGTSLPALANADIQMVQRFTGLTAADAGKTITATFNWNGSAHTTGDVLTNQFFRPFAWLIEDTDAPTQLVLNQPYSSHNFNTTVQPFYDALNSAITSLVGEFSSAYLVDVAGMFSDLFGFTVQTATGTGTGPLHLTPNNASLNTLSQGSRLGASAEVWRVASAITKTSSTDWSFTADRGYTGVDSVVGAGSATNKPVGFPVMMTDGFCLADGFHPSDYGHLLYAKKILDTLATLPVTNTKIAGSGAYYAHDQQTWPTPSSGVPGYLYPPGIGARTNSAALTQNKEWAYPQPFPRNGLITSFNAFITTGNASGLLRWCLYTDERGSPYQLIFDSGVSPGTQAATTSSTLATANVLLQIRRGLYWVSTIVQGSGSVVLRSNPGNSPFFNNYIVPDTAAGILTANPPTGKSRTGISGGATDWDNTTEALETAKLPIVFLGFESFIAA